MSYYEVCEKLNKEGWKREYNKEHRVPYAFSPAREWVGYDDIESLSEKVMTQTFIMNKYFL